MGRRLFNFAAAVSLMLCLGTVVLWVRSWWVTDLLYWNCYDDKGAFHGFEGIWSVRGHVPWQADKAAPGASKGRLPTIETHRPISKKRDGESFDRPPLAIYNACARA